MDVHFKPLPEWPARVPATPIPRRETAQFTAGYLDRLTMLESELRCLSAKDVILQAFIPKKQIRADGWPLSTAKAAGPGLILSFASNGEPREFAADHYDDWKDNLYAVAKILEALRGIDRWGGTAGKQYKGFAPMLTAPVPVPATFTSPQAAATFIAKYAGGWSASQILDNSLVVKSAFNAASLKTHPDQGGTDELFIRLQQAYELLKTHHRKG